MTGATLRSRGMRVALALGALCPVASSCDGGSSAERLGVATQAMGMGFRPTPDPALTPLPSEAVAHIGRFGSPTRLALGDDGQLYVSDTQRGEVAVFTTSGVRTGTLRGVARPLGVATFAPGPAPTIVCEVCLPDVPDRSGGRRPDCVATHRGQGSAGQGAAKSCRTETVAGFRVYVGDEADGSVKVFVDGAPAGTLGSGTGEFGKPNALAVSSDGIVYVADSSAATVRLYGYAGPYLGSFASAGLDFPIDLALDEARSELYVADFGARSIEVFDLAGGFVRSIAAPPNQAGTPLYLRPSGLGLDPFGRLYVVDNGLALVAVLDPEGNLVDSVGYREGRYWTGDVALPIDAVGDGERMYVTSNRAGRVSVFEVSP